MSLRLNVIFKGRRDRPTTARLVAGSDVLCLPSRIMQSGAEEGFGLVLAEAHAAGVPVVAYRVGGIPKAVLDGRTGILVDPGDIRGLGDALRWVLTNSSAATAMGLRGREQRAPTVQCGYSSTPSVKAHRDIAAASLAPVESWWDTVKADEAHRVGCPLLRTRTVPATRPIDDHFAGVDPFVVT